MAREQTAEETRVESGMSFSLPSLRPPSHIAWAPVPPSHLSVPRYEFILTPAHRSRQGRSTNGTLTFRRSSTTPSQSLNQANIPSEPAQPPAVAQSNDGAMQRYSREQMLAILDRLPAPAPDDVSPLLMPGWVPGQLNGNSTAPRGWGTRNDTHVLPQEPDVCWDASAAGRASNLRNINPDERDLLASDINSTVKPPQQNKDGGHAGGAGGSILNGRKTSVSQGANNNFSLASPTSASRPGTRRRETIDTNPYSGGGLMSPTTANRPGQDANPFWLGRKNTDVKDTTTFEEPEEDVGSPVASKGGHPILPFGGLIRNNTTTGATGLGGASALWGQPTATTPGASTPSAIGSFGNFALPGSTASAIGEKRPGNVRGESRLAHLIPKDSSDSMASRAQDAAAAAAVASWRARPRTDTDPFGGDDNLSGSAVLGGAQDTSPPPLSSQPHRGQGFDTPVKGSAGDFGMAGLHIGGHHGEHDHEHGPMSPSDTNPYRSPPADRGGDHDEGDPRIHAQGLGLGGPEHMQGGFGGGVSRAFGQSGFEGSDRSQTSSVGAKAYPSLGNLGGWPTSATPDRERVPFGAAFGNSLFTPMGDLHSPSLGNLSGVFGPPGAGLTGSGSMRGGSKLGSLFPPAMQSQMQGHDDNLGDSLPDLRQANPLGAIGRNAFGDHGRETESPMRPGRGGIFAEMFGGDASRAQGTSEPMPGGIAATAPGQGYPQSSGTPFGGSQPSEPPSAQARTMVMPDRMRWVYLDPQGQQQGPFTGLEMNDWYKANFFTADLRVKKVEDTEFEPLGQLIRRIGNSREPFLVPQIGIPHGPPPTSAGPFASGAGPVQPPLVGAFPSFGRTLTAQEQNDLERRKQEEQYLMAQQRDMLTNQQRLARAQLSAHPGLHHHSSAHSLQSQPSFGSIASPVTMPPQAPIGPVGGGNAFFGGLSGHQALGHGNTGLDVFREEDIARLSAEDRQLLASLQQQRNNEQPHAPAGGVSHESFRSRLPGTGDLVDDGEGFRGRLHEFEQIRAERDAQVEQQSETAAPSQHHEEASGGAVHGHEGPFGGQKNVNESEEVRDDESESANLNKQFQQAQAEAAKSGLPMPFPPPQSGTPLPAPAPQRVKSNLPEQYAASSRSETPDVSPSAAAQPPPLAPWAKDPTSESHRGPSLKEIQEAEAKKAAKAEEMAAAIRRNMIAQEAAREREKATALASGLPTTSTWGTASPSNATAPGGSPWTKPATVKAPAAGSVTPAPSSDKKTLAEIQREEEVRKMKAAKEVLAAVPANTAHAAGKRYADLASKPNAIPSPSSGPSGASSPAAGWATVGAGGKVKVPTGPAASRSASSTNVTKPAATPASKPVAKPPVSIATPTSGRSEAMAEFNKWVHNQLVRGITGVTDSKSN